MTNPKKIEATKKIQEKIAEANVIGVLNLRGMPSAQMQKMRASMRGEAEILVAKKRMTKRAIGEVKDKKAGIEKIEEHLIEQPALIFSKLNPFKLYAMLDKSKAPAAAKGGEISPDDILIPKGETPFAPGPVLGELQKAGLKAAIDGGKIVIKEDKIVCKAGEKIPAKTVGILAKLDIKPLTIGLDLVAAYEDGVIYGKDVLAVDQKQYIENIQTAFRNSLGLSIEAGYPTKENIEMIVGNAVRNVRAISLESGFPTKDTIEELLAKAQASMNAIKGQVKESVPEKEEEKAQEKEEKKGDEPAEKPEESSK